VFGEFGNTEAALQSSTEKGPALVEARGKGGGQRRLTALSALMAHSRYAQAPPNPGVEEPHFPTSEIAAVGGLF